MADPEQKPPFYEHRVFQGAVAVIGLAAAVWAFVGAPKPWTVASDISADKLALVNTEIVLDASGDMAEPFGDQTKLEAAAEAVGRYVVPLSNDGLALRRAGGSCSEAGELLVDFGEDHNDDVSTAAAEQQPAGQSNLVYAVRAAIDDFAGERFRGPASTKRILIFMGGEDECAEDAVSEISHELGGSEIDAVFRLVALKVSKRELKGLENFKEGLAPYADVEIRTADTEEELDEVMQKEEEEASEASASAAAAEAGLKQEETTEGEPETGPEETTETEPPVETEPPTEIAPPVESEPPPSELPPEVNPSEEVTPAPEATTSAAPLGDRTRRLSPCRSTVSITTSTGAPTRCIVDPIHV